MNISINKRGEEESLSFNVIYLVLAVMFFILMFPVPARAGGNSATYEQIYSKQIAILIDKSKPGTEIVLDISELIEKAEKNKFGGSVVSINNQEKKVSVNVLKGKGYSYQYFTSANVLWNVDLENKKLILKIK